MRQDPDPSAETAVDACERAIRRAIARGELAPMARLPPERQLAAQLGVNRTTLRAALSRLASARLLSVRQGSGYVVQDIRRVAGLALLPDLAALAEERGEGLVTLVSDLLAVRRALAQLVFERISERNDPALADRVEAAVDRFEAVASSPAPTLRDLREADLAVTAVLLEGTGSTVLPLCLNPLGQVLEELTTLQTVMYARPLENIAAYRGALLFLREPRREVLPMLLSVLEARDRATVRALSGEGPD